MGNAKLSPPWYTYLHELEAMFAGDDDVTVSFDDEEMEIQLNVNDPEKAVALSRLLPDKKKFGNVVVTISIIKEDAQEDIADTLCAAFRGNPAASRVVVTSSPAGDVVYVMFNKDAVQFYNDQMNDPFGNKTMLLQDVANYLFERAPNVFFTTEKF